MRAASGGGRRATLHRLAALCRKQPPAKSRSWQCLAASGRACRAALHRLAAPYRNGPGASAAGV